MRGFWGERPIGMLENAIHDKWAITCPYKGIRVGGEMNRNTTGIG